MAQDAIILVDGDGEFVGTRDNPLFAVCITDPHLDRIPRLLLDDNFVVSGSGAYIVNEPGDVTTVSQITGITLSNTVGASEPGRYYFEFTVELASSPGVEGTDVQCDFSFISGEFSDVLYWGGHDSVTFSGEFDWEGGDGVEMSVSIFVYYRGAGEGSPWATTVNAYGIYVRDA